MSLHHVKSEDAPEFMDAGHNSQKKNVALPQAARVCSSEKLPGKTLEIFQVPGCNLFSSLLSFFEFPFWMYSGTSDAWTTSNMLHEMCFDRWAVEKLSVIEIYIYIWWKLYMELCMKWLEQYCMKFVPCFDILWYINTYMGGFVRANVGTYSILGAQMSMDIE